MKADPPRRANQRERRGSIGRDASGRWFYVVDKPSNDGKRRQIRRRGFATAVDARVAMEVAKGQT